MQSNYLRERRGAGGPSGSLYLSGQSDANGHLHRFESWVKGEPWFAVKCPTAIMASCSLVHSFGKVAREVGVQALGSGRLTGRSRFGPLHMNGMASFVCAFAVVTWCLSISPSSK